MDKQHPSSKRYPAELKERAVRMVLELRREDPGDHGVINRVARQLGVGNESLRLGEAGRDRRRKAAGRDLHRARRARRAAQGEPRPPACERDPQSRIGFFRDRARRSTEESSRLHRRSPGSNETGGRRWGVEPICACAAGRPLHLLRRQVPAASARAQRDAEVGPQLEALWKKNYSVYGRRKLTKAAHRAGIEAGRDQVARLMVAPGHPRCLEGEEALHDESRPPAVRAPDLVNRNFTAADPTRCGSRTSPTARRGRASSTSPSSSTSSPGASSAGRRRGR
jgi:transposase-like protein